MGIPVRMQRNGRPVIQEFLEEELLYRRFKSPVPPDYFKLDDSSWSINLLVLRKDDSYNRSRFSEPNDVLLNYDYEKWNNGTHSHFDTHGIFSIPVKPIQDFMLSMDSRNFKLSPAHLPEECNYSHSEIHFIENGESMKVGEVKTPKKLKSSVRVALRRNIRVIKNASQEYLP